MAIGSSISSTAVTPGAAVTTLAKAKDGLYTYVDGSQVPTTCTMKAASPYGTNRSVQLVYKIDPGILDSFPDAKAGKCSVVVQVNATIGDVVDNAYITAFVAEIGSIITQSAVMTALLGGSYE